MILHCIKCKTNRPSSGKSFMKCPTCGNMMKLPVKQDKEKIKINEGILGNLVPKNSPSLVLKPRKIIEDQD